MKSLIEKITISPPNFVTAEFNIIGTSPYVQNKFSAKSKEIMKAKQQLGSTGKKGAKRDAKDFDAGFRGSIHVSKDGWNGIPAPAFRNAMVTACSIVGFHMTKGKLAVFVEADGFDSDDGTPLIRFAKGVPHYHESYTRNETGVVDIRPRAMWDEGWEMKVRVRFDADMFTNADIAALLMRAGQQVGVGEGRPASKKSCGMGWGLFELKNEKG